MRPRSRAHYWTAAGGTLVLLAAGVAAPDVVGGRAAAVDLPPPFVLATSGCAMAHCDGRMSDLARAFAPGPAAEMLFHDPVPGLPGATMGSQKGLGCASNGSIVACSLGESAPDYPVTSCEPLIHDTLVVYGYNASTGGLSRRWSSGTALNCRTWTSAPIVSADGGVIAADDRVMIRFAADGTFVWQATTPGGTPISPVMTDNGAVVLATILGPVSAYQNQTGQRLGVLQLSDGSDEFYTINTPAVRGNRTYVLAQHGSTPGIGRLVAVDVDIPASYDPSDPSSLDPGAVVLREAWHVDVGAPGGASPLIVGDTIYFDGDSATPGGPFGPTLFAVRDVGASGQIVWTRSMPGSIRASFARDPRGGFWTYTFDAPPDADNRLLFRLAFQDPEGDGVGNIIEQIDIDALIGEPGMHRPRSAMTITGSGTNPVMLVSVTAHQPASGIFSTYVAAIDLAARSLYWRVPVPAPAIAPGQFPILQTPSGPWTVFTTDRDGVRAIGER